jgi:multidrug efflux system membrane fusion protein
MMIALGILGGGGYLLVRHFPLLGGGHAAAANKKTRNVPIVTTTARRGDLNVYLTSLGTVTAFNTVTVRSRVDGEIMKILFTEGQMVHEGDPLAEIDPRPFEVQLAQAEGQLAKDQALLKSASLDLERDKRLVVARAAAQQQLDTQQATFGQMEGTVKSDQATVDNAKLQLVYCHITAPISGRIGLRRVDKGNLIQASDLNGLAVITQIQPIAVIFTVPQDDIFRVQQKNKTGEGLVVEAYNRDLETKLATGSLMAIDNQVDPTTGTVRLKAVFSNEQSILFPNQFVNSRLLIDTRKNAVLVENAAVQRGPSSTFAYVVKSDETVELRNLVIGPTEGDQTIIESGLAPGEVVVTEGTDKLQPGSKVQLRRPKPAATAEGTQKTEQANQRTQGTKSRENRRT